MKTQKRKHTAEFQGIVAIEALKGTEAVHQIAAAFFSHTVSSALVSLRPSIDIILVNKWQNLLPAIWSNEALTWQHLKALLLGYDIFFLGWNLL